MDSLWILFSSHVSRHDWKVESMKISVIHRSPTREKPVIHLSTTRRKPTKKSWHSYADLSLSMQFSLPETNIAPEDWWLEDYFPIGYAYIQGRTVSFKEGKGCYCFVESLEVNHLMPKLLHPKNENQNGSSLDSSKCRAGVEAGGKISCGLMWFVQKGLVAGWPKAWPKDICFVLTLVVIRCYSP